MTPPRLSPDNYARVTAIVTHATLKRTIETAFPDMTLSGTRRRTTPIGAGRTTGTEREP